MLIPMLKKMVGTMQRCAQRSTDRQSTMNVCHDLAYRVETLEREVGAPPSGDLESAYDRMAQMRLTWAWRQTRIDTENPVWL